MIYTMTHYDSTPYTPPFEKKEIPPCTVTAELVFLETDRSQLPYTCDALFEPVENSLETPVSIYSSASSVYGSDTSEESQPVDSSPQEPHIHGSLIESAESEPDLDLDALHSPANSTVSTVSVTQTSAEKCLSGYLGGLKPELDDVLGDMFGTSSHCDTSYNSDDSTFNHSSNDQYPPGSFSRSSIVDSSHYGPAVSEPPSVNELDQLPVNVVIGSVTSEGSQPVDSSPQQPITCSSLFNLVPNELTTQSSTCRSVAPDGPDTSKTPQPEQTREHQQPQTQQLQPQPRTQTQTQPQCYLTNQPHLLQQLLQQQRQQLQQQLLLQQLQQRQQRQQHLHLQQLQQLHLQPQPTKYPSVMSQCTVNMQQTNRSRMGEPDSSGQARFVVRGIHIRSNGKDFVYSGEVGANNLPDGNGVFTDKYNGCTYSGYFKGVSSGSNKPVKCEDANNKIQFGYFTNGKFISDGFQYQRRP